MAAAADGSDPVLDAMGSSPGVESMAGRMLAPGVAYLVRDRSRSLARVTFRSEHVGADRAVHGGVIAHLLDGVLGALANHRRSQARTAYLHVDFLHVVPVETCLQVESTFVHESGRKRLVHSELRRGAQVLARGEGLFVALRPGQP